MNRKILSVFILATTVSVLCIYNFWQEKSKEELLKNSLKTVGVFISRNRVAVHGTPSINIEYKVKGIKYNLKEYGGFASLKIGDTVLIEYAISNHSIARVKYK